MEGEAVNGLRFPGFFWTGSIFHMIVAVWLFVPIANAQDAHDLEVKLLCDKATYLVDEPIWIDILVISHEPDTVMIYFPCPEPGYFHFVVVEERQDTLPYCGDHVDYVGTSGKPDYELAPGDTAYYWYNLIDGFPYSANSNKLRDFPLQGDIAVSGWHMGYQANTLSIRIDKPTGSEQDANRLWEESGKGLWDEKSLTKYEEILHQYPESVYAPSACHSLIWAGRGWSFPFKYPEMANEFAEVMLERYPNSGFAGWALATYLYGKPESVKVAKYDSLRESGNPFRLRMMAKNHKYRLPTY